jgi:hypothetical protein
MQHENDAERMDSTSDRRVENNVLRHEYRVLSDAEKADMKSIKDKGQELMDILLKAESVYGPGRELSIARTKLEESVMWAVKRITR